MLCSIINEHSDYMSLCSKYIKEIEQNLFVFLKNNSMDRGAWQAIVHGVAKKSNQ